MTARSATYAYGRAVACRRAASVPTRQRRRWPSLASDGRFGDHVERRRPPRRERTATTMRTTAEVAASTTCRRRGGGRAWRRRWSSAPPGTRRTAGHAAYGLPLAGKDESHAVSSEDGLNRGGQPASSIVGGPAHVLAWSIGNATVGSCISRVGSCSWGWIV